MCKTLFAILCICSKIDNNISWSVNEYRSNYIQLNNQFKIIGVSNYIDMYNNYVNVNM